MTRDDRPTWKVEASLEGEAPREGEASREVEACREVEASLEGEAPREGEAPAEPSFFLRASRRLGRSLALPLHGHVQLLWRHRVTSRRAGSRGYSQVERD